MLTASTEDGSKLPVCKRVRESRNELKDERGGGEGGGNYSSDFDLIGISDEILFPFFSSFRADKY